jgi:hypothetical protein
MVGRTHSRRHHRFAAVAAAFALLAAVVPSAALGLRSAQTEPITATPPSPSAGKPSYDAPV